MNHFLPSTFWARLAVWLVISLALALLVGLSLQAAGPTAPEMARPASQAEQTASKLAAPPRAGPANDPIFGPAGHFGGWLAAIAAPPSGQQLYLGEGSGFTVYDLSNASQPRQIAGLPLDGEDVSGIALAGDLAFLANGDGLRVVDLADPFQPALAGRLDLEDAHGIAVANNTAYLAAFQAGLAIVDVSDPANPALRGSYDAAGRLIRADYGGETSISYTYDAAGNLVDVRHGEVQLFYLPLIVRR